MMTRRSETVELGSSRSMMMLCRPLTATQVCVHRADDMMWVLCSVMHA